jgi:hypothetical protein
MIANFQRELSVTISLVKLDKNLNLANLLLHMLLWISNWTDSIIWWVFLAGSEYQTLHWQYIDIISRTMNVCLLIFQW